MGQAFGITDRATMSARRFMQVTMGADKHPVPLQMPLMDQDDLRRVSCALAGAEVGVIKWAGGPALRMRSRDLNCKV